MLYALFAYEIHVHVQPGATLKHAKEGTESSAFWSALGGKQSYTSKKVVNEFVRDPHLFTISFNKGSSSYHVTSYYRILLCNCLLFYWYTDHFWYFFVFFHCGSTRKVQCEFCDCTFITLLVLCSGLTLIIFFGL